MTRREAPANRGMWVAVSLFVAFCLAIVIGFRAPYLTTAHSVDIRRFIVFPTMLLAFVVLVAFDVSRHFRGGKSGYLDMIRSEGGFWRRTGIVSGFAASFLATSACVAWISIVVPALATWTLASRPYADAYRVVGVEGGVNRVQIHLQPMGDRGDESWLPLYYLDFDPEVVGRDVCVIGREWAIGRTVVEVSRDPGRCRIP